MAIKIITDSCSDLPQDLLEKYNIAIIPLEIRFDDKSFLDGIDLTNKEFYNMMKNIKNYQKQPAHPLNNLSRNLKIPKIIS